MRTSSCARILWSAAAVLMAASLLVAQPADPSKKRLEPPAPAGVKTTRDIEYAKPDGKPQFLDLYLPEKADGPLPLVIWIHGGAWMGGDKRGNPALGMTGRGYAVASINYRLSQEAKWPAQIFDCKAAVRFLRAKAKEYNLDPDRFGVWGSSAGGHLVAMLGTSGGVKELEGDLGNPGVSSRVQAVCDFCGPTDFTVIDKFPNGAVKPVTQLIGGAIAENIEKTRTANPITYVSKDDPPFLILHGDQDKTVPINQSELLNEALKAAGVWVKFVPVPGAGHYLISPEATKTVNEFFDEKLKGKK